MEVPWNSLLHLGENFFFFNCHPYIHYKMFNLDDITTENIKENNEKWPYIPDHLYKILIICGSGTGKSNASLNSISQ